MDLFSPRYHEVTPSSFRSSTTSTPLYSTLPTTRALLNRADQNYLHHFDRLHAPYRPDECLSISQPLSYTCTITFFAHLPLYFTRHLVGLESAEPRSTDRLVFTFTFYPNTHLCIRHHIAPHNKTFDRHFQAKVGIHFFESDLGSDAESDTTPCSSCSDF